MSYRPVSVLPDGCQPVRQHCDPLRAPLASHRVPRDHHSGLLRVLYLRLQRIHHQLRLHRRQQVPQLLGAVTTVHPYEGCNSSDVDQVRAEDADLCRLHVLCRLLYCVRFCAEM